MRIVVSSLGCQNQKVNEKNNNRAHTKDNEMTFFIFFSDEEYEKVLTYIESSIISFDLVFILPRAFPQVSPSLLFLLY